MAVEPRDTPGFKFYERHLNFFLTKDVNGLVKNDYNEDAVLISFDFTVKGHEALKEVFTEHLDADSVDNFDYRLVRLALPAVRAIARKYFRAEVEGIERVPKGKAMIVGNHNAGITFLEPFMMGEVWYEQKGDSDPLLFLAHDAMVGLPLLGNVLLKFGCVRASMENSKKIFAEGRKLVVFPAQLGPSSPTISPGSTAKLTPSTTQRLP